MTTELRELLDGAADDTTPVDLAHRAVEGARRRRQQRFAVVGAVAAVTALVAGAVVIGPLQRTSDEPRPQDVASEGVAPLPTEMPVPDETMPTLTAGAMQAASAAYVWDSRLMLVDARTATVAAWNGFVEPEGLDTGGLDAGALRPYQVRLSPDGTTALVAMRFESSQRLLGIRIAVLDVATAEASVEELQLSDAYAESAWLEYNLMAWAPDSKTAYCVCVGGDGSNPKLGVWSLTMGDVPIDTFYARVSELAPSQISAGASGLMVQLEPMGGPWSWLADETGPAGTVPAADALAASLVDPSAFALTRGSRYGIGFEDAMEKGMMWGVLPAGPVSSLHAAVDGYVLVSRPPRASSGEPLIPDELYAHLLTEGGDPERLTFFPSGTTSTSFAADASW